MFTYDDVLKAQQESGVYMSEYDLKHAQEDPNWGMSMISNKKGYMNATTPEAQAFYHQAAEENRQSKGYSGGSVGSDYTLLNTPSSYSPKTETPSYENQYADQIQSALSNIQNKKAWSYDADNDQAYQAARKQYMREADRASADTMGRYASMTGGIPSTAAMTAGSQASDYYKSQLSDQLGNYINQDYQRYVDQLGADYDKLSALSSLEQMDYGKFQDTMGQYNVDKTFGYQQHLDNLDYLKAKDQTAYERALNEYQMAQSEKDSATQQTQYLAEYYYDLYQQTGEKKYLTTAINFIKTLDTAGIIAATDAELQAVLEASRSGSSGGSSKSSSGSSSKSSSGSSSGSATGMTAMEKIRHQNSNLLSELKKLK